MKRLVIFLMVLAMLICSVAEAQDSGFGLGVIIGEPTGISVKQWTGYRTAVDGAVAWSFEKESSMHLHGDLLFHNFHPTEAHKGKFMTYYGIGGRVKFEDDGKVGVRIPLGIDYLFANAPLDFFLEIVPILDLAPNTDFSLNAAIGIRYFFGECTCD